MAWGRSCFESETILSVDLWMLLNGILIVCSFCFVISLSIASASFHTLLWEEGSCNMDRKLNILIILIPILVSAVPILVSRIQFIYRHYIVHTDDFIETTGLSITWTKTHRFFLNLIYVFYLKLQMIVTIKENSSRKNSGGQTSGTLWRLLL